jgi:hypothetical protein
MIRVIKPKRMRLAGQVARNVDRRNFRRFSQEKFDGEKSLVEPA